MGISVLGLVLMPGATVGASFGPSHLQEKKAIKPKINAACGMRNAELGIFKMIGDCMVERKSTKEFAKEMAAAGFKRWRRRGRYLAHYNLYMLLFQRMHTRLIGSKGKVFR